MAFSGDVTVLHFQEPDSSVAVATTNIDVSASSADTATMIVPVPLMLYAFGLYCTENGAASLTGSVFLERATNVAGSDTTVVEVDIDVTDLSSGDGTLPLQTASTGSEDIDAGDVLFGPSSAFPVLITAPQVLTVRFVQTAVAGEYVPFVVGKWMEIDYTPAAVWSAT
jgi:hypothetical protein